MPVQIVHGNVLDALADALVPTMDGARRGMEGNVARAFARRWPNAFADIEEQIAYPVPLGRTIGVRPESECPFPMVLMASTLHHIDVLSDARKANVIKRALGEALSIAVRYQRRTVATAVMTGGWRLPFDQALSAMLDAARSLGREDTAVSLAIHVLGEREVAEAKTLASTKGIRFIDNGSSRSQLSG